MTTITGYTIEATGNKTTKWYVCPDCTAPFDFTTGVRVKEITSNQYRYGNGGGECLFCGFETKHILADAALNDSEGVDKEQLETGESPASLTPYADVCEALTDAVPVIQLGPGVEPERTEIVPGVTSVSHPEDAPETLVIQFQRAHEDDERNDVCETVMSLLQQTPLDSTYCPNDTGEKRTDAILAIVA